MKKYKLLFSVALLSAAIIAFQLALMQILSIVQWYHFAYMVISVALLGFGAAGSFLAIFRNWLIKHIGVLLPLLMMATGISMALVVDISQADFVRFDSYLLFLELNQAWKLLFTYLLFFIPFFFGALAIGLVFVEYVADIGTIYFANLLGSGAGGLLALGLIWFLFPDQLPACLAILPVCAGFMILPVKRKGLCLVLGSIAVLIIGYKLWNPPRLVLSQYKDLSRVMLLPEARIQLEKNSPYGLIQTVSSPVLRYAPGLSLTATAVAPVKMAAFVNGDWFGAVAAFNKGDTSFILDHTTFNLPYVMARRRSVLVLRAGTGVDIAHALSRGAESITAVEPNTVILNAWKRELAGTSAALFSHPRVSVRRLEPRTFLMMDARKYDLICLPVIGTFGGSSGLYALQEQFTLSKEALREMWLKLNPGGALSLTVWMDYPLRNPLKILASMIAVLDEAGVQDPHKHIAAVRSWGTITFVLTRSSLKDREVTGIRNFCNRMLFDPAILPQLDSVERQQYNQLQDDRFFEYVDKLFSPEREQFYENYEFNIRPATDDKPFFSQFIRWKSLNRLAGMFGSQALPFFELGYLLLIFTLAQIVLVSLILIILPLFRIGWKGQNRTGILLYFGGLGLGYMFVEMIFIQRFILYFGNPVYSASAVITSLLLFSGAGSYVSANFSIGKRLLKVLALIVFLLLAYAFLFTGILQQTVHLGLMYKMLIVLLLTAPLAFLMGIPFPAGLLNLSKSGGAEIPWAWGINGCVSVISTALATLIAVELGFKWVMLVAALGYCSPLLVLGVRHLKNARHGGRCQTF